MHNLHLFELCSKKMCGLCFFILIHRDLFLHHLSRLSHTDGRLGPWSASEREGSHMACVLRIPAETPVAGWQSLCPPFPWGTGSPALPVAPAAPWASHRWTAAVTLCAPGPSGPAGDKEEPHCVRETKEAHLTCDWQKWFVISSVVTNLPWHPLRGILKEPHCGKSVKQNFMHLLYPQFPRPLISPVSQQLCVHPC